MISSEKFSTCPISGTGSLQGSLSDYLGQWVVLYFYPKDATPGCTQEGIEFTGLQSKFDSLGAKIFGVSRDSVNSHEKFKEKQQYSFDLISDSDETLCQAFNVIKEKNMYGKKVMGIERSTFILNPQGNIAHEWRKVKVPGHALEVLHTLQGLIG